MTIGLSYRNAFYTLILSHNGNGAHVLWAYYLHRYITCVLCKMSTTTSVQDDVIDVHTHTTRSASTCYICRQLCRKPRVGCRLTFKRFGNLVSDRWRTLTVFSSISVTKSVSLPLTYFLSLIFKDSITDALSILVLQSGIHYLTTCACAQSSYWTRTVSTESETCC